MCRFWTAGVARTLMVLGLVVGFAGNADAVMTESSALQIPQGQFVQNLGDQAIHILADKALKPDQRQEHFRRLLETTFDMPTIGHFVLGRLWNSTGEAQRIEYMDLFERLLLKSYSARFALYTGEGFKVISVRPEGDRDVVVVSNITHPDGSAPTTVEWRVRQNGTSFGIIDVVVEGVSMSVTQRQEYASVIQRNGGEIEGLLRVMRQNLAADSSKG